MRPVVFVILAINVVVFGMWLWLGESPLMTENFLVSWDGLMAGRWWTLLMPRARLLLLGLIPMPAIVGALLFVAIDMAGLFAQFEGGGLPIGHGAHLGGAVTGALFYFLVLRRLDLWTPDRVDYGDVATWRRLMAQTDVGRRE